MDTFDGFYYDMLLKRFKQMNVYRTDIEKIQKYRLYALKDKTTKHPSTTELGDDATNLKQIRKNSN